MLIKQLKLLIPIVIGVIFLAILSSPILASNGMSAQNDLGSFYIKDQIVYFKGTLLGETYTDYVKLTGSSYETKLNGRSIKYATKVYAVDGVIAIVNHTGRLYAHGANADDVFQVSDANGVYLVAGNYSNGVESVIMSNKGASIKLKDGTNLVKGSHIIESGKIYDPLLSGSSTEDVVVLENNNLVRTADGKLWLGKTQESMTAVDVLPAFNGETITDIKGSSSSSDIDQMWALTDAGRLLHSTDGTTWTEKSTNVQQLFHSPSGETLILKNDGTYHNSSLNDLDNFTAIPVDSVYGTLTNVMYDGDSIILHSGNDLYKSTGGSDISHHYQIEPTIIAGGFNLFGIHPDTLTEFDPNGVHSNTTNFDADGLSANRTEFDANGLTVDNDEWDSRGFNLAGYNNITSTYFGEDHKTATGDDFHNGRDWEGNTADGIDLEGFDQNGYNTLTSSYFGEDHQTKEGDEFHNGYDWQGLDENGFNEAGYWRDSGKLFSEEGDFNCKTKTGGEFADYGSGFLEDCDGFDADGFAVNGFHGETNLNRREFQADGIHPDTANYFHPTDNLTIDLSEFDPQTNLTHEDLEFGSDTLTWNDEVYGTNGRDYLGYDENGFLENGMHKNTTLYDDEGFSMEGWNEDGVFRDGMTIDNGHLAKDFSMAHAIARDSFFRTLVKTSMLVVGARTNLGTIFVRNNTRDGFELSIDSNEGGILKPSSTIDGEIPIPYSVTLTKKGRTGLGIDETLVFGTAALATAHANKNVLEVVAENGDVTGIRGSTILAVAGVGAGGIVASSPTDVEYELYMDIQDDTDAMKMAGTYTDVLTITYLDR